MLVPVGSPFSFNYTTYDQAHGLFVAGMVYDVTSGIPIFVQNIQMPELNGSGVYVGQFNPTALKAYMVIGIVYTEGTYTVIDPSRAPSVDFYLCGYLDTTQMNINYGAYDMSPDLFLQATIYDMANTGSPIFVPLIYVTAGIYFCQSIGVIGKDYEAVVVAYTDDTYTTIDPSRAPDTYDFECFVDSEDPGADNVLDGIDYVIGTVPKQGTYVPFFQNTNRSFVPIPNVFEGLSEWLQPMTFVIVMKTTVNFELVEASQNYNFRGVWQPMTQQKLSIKPIGQRAWPWFTVHSPTRLPLKVDDVINYNGTQFRVMEKWDWTGYGFYEYHLVQDYNGSGP